MRGSIRATLAAYAGKTAYGPLAERIRQDADHRIYAAAVADSLEDRVRDLGITVLRGEVYEEARYKKYFSDDAVDRVRNAIGHVHHQLDRRIRDAKSVALVARLKGENRSPSSVLKAGTIFVTRNSALYSRVSQALSIGRNEPDPRFAIATDGQIAGVLWFVLGVHGVEMSRKRLIANCAAAVLPRRDVIDRISSMLIKIDKKLGDEFEALMRDGRASLCPMRFTGGYQDVVDEDLSLKILGAMKEELVAPVKEAAILEQEELSEITAMLGNELSQTKDAVNILQEVVDAEVRDKEQVKRAFDLSLAQLSHELEVSQAREAQVRTDAERDLHQRVKQSRDVVSEIDAKEQAMFKRIRRISYGGVTLITLATFFFSHFYIKVLAAAVAVACLPFVWPKFDQFLAALARWHFRKERGVLDKLTKQ